MEQYPAYVVTEPGPAALTRLTDTDLPDGDVTVDIAYSSLNFKDGLSVAGKGRIARRFPMTAGIDLAGTVARSESPDWAPGDDVILTGWGLSETHPGAYTTRQRVRSEWLVRRPEGLDAARAMAIGTAGLTAMLCVQELENHGVRPGDGDVLVTGAAGGVGSVAVAVLAQLGYDVVASTGRPEEHDHLTGLGARSFLDRAELGGEPGRPLQTEQWVGAIDTVGSSTLANVLSRTAYRGTVAACGLAAGNDLPTTVLPFILRGVKLIGVDSVMCPTDVRTRAWQRLATDLPVDKLDALTTTRGFGEIPQLAEDILAGRTRGRVVIDIAGTAGDV
ncbi:MAG: oxidoreductase [Rhodococcus sp.]|uniref:MDR family oxidoreductase n=1 Tax=Rhodococcus sp. TaxID=1831 RepID=UPI00169A2B06|nr:MDR family oxidoreductase [Rhodococcus sp. (in: high G+C Gram-positive bacteria)]NLV81017.1 oxidoreductase [Rhodococcus sp. (in: high G+C Gram-positive bacteria)]